jgi:hypothetical protein
MSSPALPILQHSGLWTFKLKYFVASDENFSIEAGGWSAHLANILNKTFDHESKLKFSTQFLSFAALYLVLRGAIIG